MRAADFRWLEDAKSRYANLGVKTLVMGSPIPACDTQIEVYHKALDAHLDKPVSTLPIRYFNDSDRHFTLEGSKLVSASIALRILSLDAKAYSASIQKEP